ncbi:hypothetical protein QF044_001180 [Chryseobacterium sp. W4I1]|nr:hypothetical protein [Chryseobacterium sp. W4I1]
MAVGYPDDGVIWLYKYESPLPNNKPYPVNEQQTVDVNLTANCYSPASSIFSL